MNKKIIINSTIDEVRIAITEDDKLAEFYIELPDKERYVGNIYLGKVRKIVQGLNAAFIDIGLKQDAFLHFSDVDESLEQFLSKEDDDFGFELDDEDDDLSNDDVTSIKKAFDSKTDVALRRVKPEQNKNNGNFATFHTKKFGEVQINIQPKQDLIVQVVREAYGNKGVKVTTKIAIPGRNLVLLPFDNLLGISRKINSFNERKRLRSIARKIIPKGYGCIIRTAANGKSEEELKKDWNNLLEIWKEIEQKVRKSKSPSLLYQDMQLTSSIIRDLFNNQVDKLIVDSKKIYKEVLQYLKKNSPELIEKLELYTGDRPVFDFYGIEKDLKLTYKRRVPLSSGGSIVIDQTEAMTVIDVNSGKAIDKEQEKNALRVNLEAAKEIARQLRLRDIGGMIIVDFIDMENEQNRKKIYTEMKALLSRDRAKTVIYPLTQLSLMQITRQRINQNIAEKTSEICPMCNGSGRVTSKTVLINSIERWLRNFRSKSREFRLILHLHPTIADYISSGTFSKLTKLMLKYFIKIKLFPDYNLGLDEFRFVSTKTGKDITREYL